MSNQQQSQTTNSQTLVINSDEFHFETLEQQNGMATVVKFKLENPDVQPGDVLLILSGSDIQFHGFIGNINEGWAIAMDRSGSQLPAAIH